jgi:hypothetical protein
VWTLKQKQNRNSLFLFYFCFISVLFQMCAQLYIGKRVWGKSEPSVY